jgi:hypothetical protein
MQTKWLSGAVAAGALLFTYGCGGAQNGVAVRAQEMASAPGAPVVVSCEPTQRTLVRPVLVNGATISQIECVPGEGQSPYAQVGATQPATAPAQAIPAAYTYAPQPVYRDLAPARVETAPARTVARPVRTRQVVYEEPVKKPRSVKKSVAIIGSSAAVGAGVGAITGGKKGALIGAAIGGGGAAIWDQITRRK